MRILCARLVLPARMKPMAAGEARQIAETVARALHRQGTASPHLSIRVDGLGRPATHLQHDLAAQTARAVAARRREG